jgi:hypothetical protein
MAAWAANRPLTILANTDTVSAVRDTRTGALGITFWRAASIEGIQSNAAAVVYFDGQHLYAADPNANAAGTFQLTIPGLFNANVPSTRTTRSTTLTIPRAAGQTTHVVLTKVPQKRRSVR